MGGLLMIAEQVRAAASRLAKSVIKGPFKPAGLYQYTSADGSPSYWRFRADLENGRKVIRPFRRNGDRYVLGEPEFPDGKPLYRLDDLTRRTEETVWFVEGEKCADALAKFGILATTSGSASSDEDADYNPLAGRVVVVWADYDPDTFPDGKEHLLGQKHMQRVAEKLTALGCHVEMIDIRKLGLPQNGSDCVDWVNNDPDARRQDIEALPRCAPVVEQTAHIAVIPHIPEHEWDDVVKFGETNTPEIPTSLLPGWLGTYAEAVRLNTQTPSGMSVMLALSTTAASVQRRFQVSPFGDSYIEPLSLWTVTALPPASRKTAVISAFTAPLSEWERNQAAERSSEISRREAERKVTQRRMDKLEVDASKEDDPLIRNKLIKEIAEC
jgi:hypothetical protein